MGYQQQEIKGEEFVDVKEDNDSDEAFNEAFPEDMWEAEEFSDDNN